MRPSCILIGYRPVKNAIMWNLFKKYFPRITVSNAEFINRDFVVRHSLYCFIRHRNSLKGTLFAYYFIYIFSRNFIKLLRANSLCRQILRIIKSVIFIIFIILLIFKTQTCCERIIVLIIIHIKFMLAQRLHKNMLYFSGKKSKFEKYRDFRRKD